ncbi:MAG: DUF937 domain-containing protein [Pseudomonadota bacterium]
MNITDILSGMGGLRSVASELGVTEAQAASGAEALLPAILGGFKKQAQGGDAAGLGGLGGLLGQLGGGSLLDQVLSPQPTDPSAGNDVLGQIFGSRDVSRTVAQDAASRTGLDAGLLKKMLPLLAMMVAGYMAKQGGAPAGQASAGGGGLGGLGGLLGGLLGGGQPGAQAGAGASSGLGGLGSLLDMNGDGNALDDILKMAGKAMR